MIEVNSDIKCRTELFVVLAQIWLGMYGYRLECLVGAKVSDDAINNKLKRFRPASAWKMHGPNFLPFLSVRNFDHAYTANISFRTVCFTPHDL